VNEPLNVLMVEDSANDAALLEIELQRAGYDPLCQRVETREDMLAALTEQSWDVIIADYVMPHFNGLEALALARDCRLDLPFIIVSGHIADTTAVAAMKAGAHDYVMKGNLARLGPAVRRELREAEVRRENRRADQWLKAEHSITRLLAGAQSLSEAAPSILHSLIESLEMDLGTLWVEDPDLEALCHSATNMRAPSAALEAFFPANRQLRFALGSDLPGRVWHEHRAIWISDLAAQTHLQRHELFANAHLVSALLFPIQSPGVFGVLELFASRRMEHDPRLDNMMLAIGSELGQFIQRRKAEEALRRAHDELEARVQRRTAELKAANSKLHGAMAERKRLEIELLEITERERRRIGLDLHDDLGQKLSGLALMTKGLALKLAREKSQAARDASRIQSLVQEAMTHASDLAHDLAALDLAEKDLTSALENLASRARGLFNVSCRFISTGSIPPLDPSVVTQLYKIAQEAVTNAIKHGKATRVGINLENGARELTLSIRNNGVPFPDLRSHSTGMGLRIMNYRAHIISASLDIRAKGDRGTLVTCSVPLDPKK